jgi:hypothetical protein
VMKDALKEFASKLAESPIGLLIAFGAAMILLAAASGVSYDKYQLVIDPLGRLALGAAGIAFTLLGTIFVWQSPRSVKPYGISILTPSAGDDVEITTVRGTIRKAIPASHQLWVLRFYPDGEFVPLHEANIDLTNQTWAAYQCAAGGSKGDVRFFVAALVGPDGQAMLDYFLQASDRHNAWMNQLNVPYEAPNRFLPKIAKKSRDVVECDRVQIKKA